MNPYAYYVIHKNGWGTGFGPRPTHCNTCHAPIPEQQQGACSTGYGTENPETIDAHPDAPVLKPGEHLERSAAVCYACCGKQDLARMCDTGRMMLYLTTSSPAHVSNWPGSLSFPVSHISRGRHNIARVRYDISFTGPDGKPWRGTQYGDNTQICYCRRLSK